MLAQLSTALSRETNPAPLKYALSLLGLMSAKVRLPLVEPTLDTRREEEFASFDELRRAKKFKLPLAARLLQFFAPKEGLLIETDSPYLAPVPKRGKRNEPALIVHTARKLAELRGQSLEELSRVTSDNFRRLLTAG